MVHRAIAEYVQKAQGEFVNSSKEVGWYVGEKMSEEQKQFIRLHGVTLCPPGPEFRVNWKTRFDTRNTEDEYISTFSRIELQSSWNPKTPFIKGMEERRGQVKRLQRQK